MATPDAMDDLWEEMDAFEVGGEGIGRGSGGVVKGTIRLQGRWSLRGS